MSTIRITQLIAANIIQLAKRGHPHGMDTSTTGTTYSITCHHHMGGRLFVTSDSTRPFTIDLAACHRFGMRDCPSFCTFDPRGLMISMRLWIIPGIIEDGHVGARHNHCVVCGIDSQWRSHTICFAIARDAAKWSKNASLINAIIPQDVARIIRMLLADLTVRDVDLRLIR